MKKLHVSNFDVYYEDTDASGFAYHTTYLRFAERARSSLVKDQFPELMELMIKNTFFFVVREIKIKYLSPSFLNDKLFVETFFMDNSLSSIILVQHVLKKNKIICEIKVELVWLNGKLGKPSRIPKNIIARFNSFQVV